MVLFLQTLTWTGTYSIYEVCNFPCQNMTVTPKIAGAFALVYPGLSISRTDLHSAVLLGGEDGDKAGNKEHLKRLYNICH